MHAVKKTGINIVFEMKKLVVFDLDGTLLDTIGDLAAACDYVLKGHHLPTHTQDEYHSYVGNGVKKLIERTLTIIVTIKETNNEQPQRSTLSDNRNFLLKTV